MKNEIDSRQLRQLLEDHFLDCFGWAVHCCRGDREEAAEVVQTSFLKILQGKARYGGKSDFKTWLFGVIRNTSASFRRRLVRRLRLLSASLPDEPPSRGTALRPRAEQALQEAQQAERLTALLAQLSPRQRDLLHLVFYQEMTVDEAAAALDITPGSARVHYHRGKKRLKRLLDESEENNHERSWIRRDQTAL